MLREGVIVVGTVPSSGAIINGKPNPQVDSCGINRNQIRS